VSGPFDVFPFNMPAGPEFIGLYAVLSAVTLGTAAVLRDVVAGRGE
jgi:hypothetical protein